jgi:CubicO group peptidase (beta-lactamase class C family)
MLLKCLLPICSYIFIGLWLVPSVTTAQPSHILQQRIDEIVANYLPQNKLGLTIGIIDDGYMYQYQYGSIVPNAQLLPDSNTLFRIGSVSKTFVATLLQALTMQQVVNGDMPVAHFLPDSINAQNPYWQSITLHHLATYTAGLPKDPPNLAETYTNSNNLYEHYSLSDLYRSLLTFKPQNLSASQAKGKKNAPKSANDSAQRHKPINSRSYSFNYSHWSYLLLAHCLERASGKTYNELLQTYILQPLQLQNTTFAPQQAQTEQQARGFLFNGQAQIPLSWGDVPQAEGLYSTCSDMLNYVNAYLTANAQSVFTMINRPTAPTSVKNVSIAGGWFLFRRNKRSHTVLSHSGRTGGYACYAAFVPANKVGVVLMANSDQHIDELGIAILEFLLR